MANYAYIVRVNGWEPYQYKAAIEEAITRVLPNPSLWRVSRLRGGNRTTFWVHIPGSASGDYMEANKAEGEDYGFILELEKEGPLAFRHGGNAFERWAQGCMEEVLCDLLHAADPTITGVLYDATGEVEPVGTRYYRKYPTFSEFLLGKHRAYLNTDLATQKILRERYLAQCPQPLSLWWGPIYVVGVDQSPGL